MIEAFRNIKRGTVAVDDVRIRPGACSVSTIQNFDNGLGLYMDAPRSEDKFDWIVRSGSTPSQGTGPKSDHTYPSGKGNIIV